MRDIMKKMRVSEHGVSHERYVVHINENLSCYAVRSSAEKDYEQGIQNVPLLYWPCCEESIEHEYRAFEPGEMSFNYIDTLFRFKDPAFTFIYVPSVMDVGKTNLQIMIGGQWICNADLLEEYEVCINGEWVPVGVKL